ncbi:hypothetical protein [Rouxiella badensis]|uniref:hypothetical protein n=1 Tax=Rouxiella badensis TaxID=1646377 RepID=UPI00301BF10A
MKKEDAHIFIKNKMPKWFTIREAIDMVHHATNLRLTESDIYRHALQGDIFLSIYFQSPIALKKMQLLNNKLKLKVLDKSIFLRLCFLEKKAF